MLSNKHIPDAYDVIIFFDLLDHLDSFQIEEGKDLEEVTLDSIKAVNSGNNCLHYILVCNNSRIVIQTYKEMNHSKVDVVQGKPECEIIFEEIIDFINQNKWITDNKLNQLFVLYNWYKHYCFTMYFGEMDSFCCDFGPDISCWWSNYEWKIKADTSIRNVKKTIWFIDQIEKICKD